MALLSRRNFCLSSAALYTSAIVTAADPTKKVVPSNKTGYAFDNDFASFWNNSAETFLRAEWINSQLILSGVRDELVDITPHENPMKYIKKLHTKDHIDSIEKIPASNGFSLTIGETAQTAVGYVLGAVKAVCEGEVRNAFCCIRPPGHHVQNSGELGYCCYANVVLAAKYARQKHNIRRILIIDWDYHQGNGTHGFICGDDDILFFETYNPPMYSTDCNDYIITGPDHIFPKDAKRINIMMPDGSTNSDFVRTFESKLVTAAEQFKPELVLISCGFDLKKYDNHGTFNVTAKGISQLTQIVRQIADTYAGGKLVSMLEGGYADSARDRSIYGTNSTFSGLSQCAENHVKTLITGDVYDESPFYKGATSIHMAASQKEIWKSGLLSGLPKGDGPWSITISQFNGKVIKQLYRVSNVPQSINNLGLPTGRYILSIKGKTGKINQSINIQR